MAMLLTYWILQATRNVSVVGESRTPAQRAGQVVSSAQGDDPHRRELLRVYLQRLQC